MKNNSFYKGQDILNNNFRNIMNNYFNPYEYNFESNLKDEQNMDIINQKSKSHSERSTLKK
ncbi:MAG: hypothetical protein E7161_00785 [Firmicutes bacterium]|nr:hypothetical protein [Bacillota bacterium]